MQGHHKRHWIYTGPVVIVSAALDAFHTDGIGVNTADVLQQRKARSLPDPTVTEVHTSILTMVLEQGSLCVTLTLDRVREKWTRFQQRTLAVRQPRV